MDIYQAVQVLRDDLGPDMVPLSTFTDFGLPVPVDITDSKEHTETCLCTTIRDGMMVVSICRAGHDELSRTVYLESRLGCVFLALIFGMDPGTHHVFGCKMGQALHLRCVPVKMPQGRCRWAPKEQTK